MQNLKDFIDLFVDAEESTHHSREIAELSRDFYDGYQWTSDEAAELANRGQTSGVYNRVKRKIDHLTGLEKQLRTDAKAFARTPEHENDTEAVTDAVRFVLDNNEFDQERSDAFEEMIVEGTMGFEVIAQNNKDKTILINRIPWDRIFYDPHSRRKDFSDATYKGVVVWMDAEFAKAKYGEKAEEIEQLMHGGGSETYDDIPKHRFVDTNRKRVRVFSLYYKKPAKQGFEWFYVEFAYNVMLKEPVISPWVNDKKETQCGYEFQSAFVDRDGNRYGLVKEMLDPQREVNSRRSKAKHLMSVRQTAAVRGAVEDEDEMRYQLAKVDGHISVNPGFFDQWKILDTNDMATAQFNLLNEAKAEIDGIGPNVFLQGTDSAVDASGRALQSRQQAQMTGLGGLFDGLRQCQKRVYEQAWYRIRQLWTGEKWIRVTDNERNTKFSMINKTRRTALREQGQEFAFNRDGMITNIDSSNDPALNEIVGTNVAMMNVDFVLEDVPDTVTIQQEQFQILAELYKVNPQEMSFDDLIELSALRNKEKILARKRGENLTPQEQQALQQRQQQEADQEKMETAKTMADTRKSQASADKTQVEALKGLQELNRTAQLPIRG